MSGDSNKNKVILSFVVVLIFALILGVFLSMTTLAPLDFVADNTSRTFVFDSGSMADDGSVEVVGQGEIFGYRHFSVEMQNEPYRLISGTKRLSQIKVTGDNFPLNSAVTYCVQAYNSDTRIQRPVLCEGVMVGSGDVAEWNLDFGDSGIIVTSENEYSCTTEIDLLDQSADPSINPNIDCELTLEPIIQGEVVYDTIPAGLLTMGTIAEGEGAGQLNPEMRFKAQRDLKILGVRNAIIFDNTNSSRIVKPCIKKVNDGEASYCSDDFELGAGESGSAVGGLFNEPLDVADGEEFQVECSTTTGTWGKCLPFIVYEVDLTTEEPYNRRDYFTLNSMNIDRYCDDTVSDQNNPMLVRYKGTDGEELSVEERCKAILSSERF